MASTVGETIGFELVTETEVDGRGRVSIAKAGAQPGTRYRVSRRLDGEILLTPVVSIPRRELLVWDNPELARTILAGLAEAERGETVDLGDFTRDVDDEGDR
ncbi:MAG: hypothetical protein ACRD0K_10450 [Egibacteraceae bacterium]